MYFVTEDIKAEKYFDSSAASESKSSASTGEEESSTDSGSSAASDASESAASDMTETIWGTFSITAINRRSSIKKSKSQFQASMSCLLYTSRCV